MIKNSDIRNAQANKMLDDVAARNVSAPVENNELMQKEFEAWVHLCGWGKDDPAYEYLNIGWQAAYAAALSLESKQGWMGIETLEDKEHCWLYTKDLGVFEGCKIGGGYYVEYAISHLTGESIFQETVGTDEAKLDPLLVWQPNRVPIPSPPTTSPEIVEDK